MTIKKSQPDLARTRQGAGCFWNLLTLVMLAGIIGVLGLAGWVYLNPYVPVNPFPPPTLPAVAVLPSPMPATATALPPTATHTPTVTATPVPTATPTPSLTPTATAPAGSPTPPPGSPSPTPRPTATPGGYAFVVKDAPLAIQNIFHSELGCNWLGIGGNIEDLHGGGKLYVTIHLHGSLGGRPIDVYTVSGAAHQYGEGGYEFQLAESPIASHNSLYIQLLDQANLPLSDRVYFDTFEDCEQNSIIINFQQVR